MGSTVDFVGELFATVSCVLAIIFCMSWLPFGSLSLEDLFGGIVDSGLTGLTTVIALENF